MVNDENDKWSDNGDLPINTVHTPEQLEERSKKKILNNQKNDQKITIKDDHANDLNVSTKDKSITNGKILKNDLTKEQINREDSIKRSTKEKLIDKEKINKEELIKGSTKNDQPKEEYTITKIDESTKSESKDLVQEVQELKSQLSKLKEEAKERKELSYLKDFGKYVKSLGSTVGQLTEDLKTFTNAKSWEAIQRGNIDVRRYANYYDVHGTITTATASDPQDFDSAAYNVERIFESLERYAEIIYVANDGTDNLYVIVSHGGRTRFSTEAIVYPGEVKCYYNTYEIRLRSPTAGLAYRVTEYCIANISEISSIPIEKANLHNQPLPAINTNWLAADITPTNYPTTFMIEVAVSIAGNFRAIITRGINSQIVTFNVVPGPALVAGGLYIFNLLVHNGDSVNFTYSTTGGTIQILRVQELDSASA